jgi:hypothetical protein
MNRVRETEWKDSFSNSNFMQSPAIQCININHELQQSSSYGDGYNRKVRWLNTVSKDFRWVTRFASSPRYVQQFVTVFWMLLVQLRIAPQPPPPRPHRQLHALRVVTW